MCVCVCVCVCVCLCVKVKKSIFKVFFYNLKTNEKPMVNNYNYCINKIFNKIILKKLSHATRGYATSDNNGNEIQEDEMDTNVH